MVENLVHTPYHQQLSLSKAGDVITQSHPTLDNIHLRLVRVNSINRQRGLVGVTGPGDQTVNGDKIKKTIEKVQLPVKNYGINRDGNAFGTFPQVGVGDRVLIGYVGGTTSNPIVLGIYPEQSFSKHLTPVRTGATKTQGDNFDQYRSQKEVLPSQQVELKTGKGDYERTLNGDSFIACLDPGDTNLGTQPWRHDDYTGRVDGFSYGEPLSANKDQADGSQYQIQNPRAQDWVKVHQSNTSDDHHITKRLIRQDGSVHNYIGNKLFKNDSITEDISTDKGYKLSHKSGRNSVKTNKSINHLVEYALNQVDRHPYGFYSVKGKYPRKSIKRKGYDYYNGKYIRANKWGFDNDIIYNPRKGTSNGVNFIYSVLRECHFDVPKHHWITSQLLYDDLSHNVKMPQKGDIAFKFTVQKVHSEESFVPINIMSKPSILVQNYHGPKTRCVAEYREAKNVKETTLDHLYDLGRHRNGRTEFLVIARPTKTTVASANFKIHNTNSIDMSVIDPKIPNWANENQFTLGPSSSSWTCMNHKISLNKKGVYIDGHRFDYKGNDSRINKLQDENEKLSNKLNNLIQLLKTLNVLPKNMTI